MGLIIAIFSFNVLPLQYNLQSSAYPLRHEWQWHCLDLAHWQGLYMPDGTGLAKMCGSNLSSGYVERSSALPLYALERALFAGRSLASGCDPWGLHVPEHEEWVGFSCSDKYRLLVSCR